MCINIFRRWFNFWPNSDLRYFHFPPFLLPVQIRRWSLGCGSGSRASVGGRYGTRVSHKTVAFRHLALDMTLGPRRSLFMQHTTSILIRTHTDGGECPTYLIINPAITPWQRVQWGDFSSKLQAYGQMVGCPWQLSLSENKDPSTEKATNKINPQCPAPGGRTHLMTSR